MVNILKTAKLLKSARQAVIYSLLIFSGISAHADGPGATGGGGGGGRLCLTGPDEALNETYIARINQSIRENKSVRGDIEDYVQDNLAVNRSAVNPISLRLLDWAEVGPELDVHRAAVSLRTLTGIPTQEFEGAGNLTRLAEARLAALLAPPASSEVLVQNAFETTLRNFRGLSAETDLARIQSDGAQIFHAVAQALGHVAPIFRQDRIFTGVPGRNWPLTLSTPDGLPLTRHNLPANTPLALGAYCTNVQIATQLPDDAGEGTGRLAFDPFLYGKLSRFDQASLWLHEAIFNLYLRIDKTYTEDGMGSYPVRDLTRKAILGLGNFRIKPVVGSDLYDVTFPVAMLRFTEGRFFQSARQLSAAALNPLYFSDPVDPAAVVRSSQRELEGLTRKMVLDFQVENGTPRVRASARRVLGLLRATN